MRAIVYHGRSDVRIEDVDEPTPGAGEVKIKVENNGICGTDLHEYYDGPIFISTAPHPLTGAQIPQILGHEFSGTVVGVGAGVSDVREGDRVCVEPIYRCDECPRCRAGFYNLCQKIAFHGLMSHGGGLSEYTVVPARTIHHLPDSVSLQLGALVEPMSVGYHAARRGELTDGESAVVLGAGPIGIGTYLALRGLGISDVTVIEPSAVRRESIQKLGATSVLDPLDTDPVAYVRDHTGGVGAAAVYETAGVDASFGSAVDMVAARRRIVEVAICDHALPLNTNTLVFTEAVVVGSLAYTGEDFAAVLDLMSRGHYVTDGWVEHIGLDEIVDEGFAALRAQRKMKVLVDVGAGR
jgi:(R,R)-butanediol dehydrogenase/meso-butanediol dehydrogenase/diacetyl reductase